MLAKRVTYCLISAFVALAAPAIGESRSLEFPSVLSSVSTSTVPSFIPLKQTVATASNDANHQTFPQGTDEVSQAINGDLGATILSEDNIEILQQNPDAIAPPTTDSGSTYVAGNAKWPFALSHNRLYAGGWAREQNGSGIHESLTLSHGASVIMRLEAGALQELHWHTTAEGSTQVTAVNSEGQVFVDTVHEGDLWYFPASVPHSLHATDDNPDGSEFLLVFDDGTFSPESTFGLTDWAAHTPKEVLAKNFQVDISAFDHIPSEDPAGKCDAVSRRRHLEPHWHPTQAEWSYFITGTARMTLFAGSSSARTFDYQAGDIGCVPPSFGHYIENTGTTTLQFLEMFNSDRVEDISLTFNKTKHFVVGPRS
ncbi:hypothetical protein ACEPAF_8380 [Sanghuangporus sanghuang]